MSEYFVLIQFFVVTPVCHFLLTNPRVNGNSKLRGLLYACLFLLATALLMTYLSLQTQPPSYYSILSVPTTASSADIRRAYKAAAVRLHPDKNPDASAAAEFTLMTRAYEVLEKAETRALYDKYGAAAADYAMTHPSAAPYVTQATFDTALFYVLWLALTYILCLGRDAVMGRNGAWVLLFLTGLAEYQMLYSSFNPLSLVFPYTPLHHKLHFLHALYPSLMNAARLLSQFLFVDYDAIDRVIMQQILASNVAILTTLRQVQASVERGGGGEGREVVDDGTGTGSLPIGLRLRNEESRVNRLQAQLEQTKQKGQGGLPSWVVPLGLFFAFNYFGRSGSGGGERTS